MLDKFPEEIVTLREDFFDSIKRVAKCEREIKEIINDFRKKNEGKIVVANKNNPRIGVVSSIFLQDFEIICEVSLLTKRDYFIGKKDLHDYTHSGCYENVEKFPNANSIYSYHVKLDENDEHDIEEIIHEYNVNPKNVNMMNERRKIAKAMSGFLPKNIKFRTPTVGPSRVVSSIKRDLTTYKIDSNRSRRMAEMVFYGNLFIYPFSKTYDSKDEYDFYHVLLTWDRDGKSIYLNVGSFEECLGAARDLVCSGIVSKKKKLIGVKFSS